MLLIYRPGHMDWSLPKGKTKADESDEEAALREIEEEVGVRGELGRELPSTSYRDAQGRDKVVRYWAVELPAGAEPFPGDGVTDVRWVPLAEAQDLLSWDRDRSVVAGLEEAIR